MPFVVRLIDGDGGNVSHPYFYLIKKNYHHEVI